jgi:prepilin-type N-terminal cleavage/methylation domain-containing protein
MRGFSLIELMVVIVLVGIMLGVATMSLSGLRSTTLSTATRQVADYINVCRSRAISQHTAIRIGVVVDSLEEIGPTNDDRMNRFSSWAWNKRTKSFEQFDAWQRLPGDLVFESREANFVRASEYASKDPASIRGHQVFAEIAPNPMNVNGQTIRFFQFSPTGRVSVEDSEDRNLIIVIRSGESQNEFKGTNWAQVNIDTLTGRVRIYRP